jgi:hypothetical protein
MMITRRARTVILLAVLLISTLSGCAVVPRLLTVVGVLQALDPLIDPSDRSTRDQHSDVGQIRARVDVREGSGLWLDAEPAAGRVARLPAGMDVVVLCRAQGPRVRGSQGTTSDWLRIRVPDGRTGYASAAFLERDEAPPDQLIDSCGP